MAAAYGKKAASFFIFLALFSAFVENTYVIENAQSNFEIFTCILEREGGRHCENRPEPAKVEIQSLVEGLSDLVEVRPGSVIRYSTFPSVGPMLEVLKNRALMQSHKVAFGFSVKYDSKGQFLGFRLEKDPKPPYGLTAAVMVPDEVDVTRWKTHGGVDYVDLITKQVDKLTASGHTEIGKYYTPDERDKLYEDGHVFPRLRVFVGRLDRGEVPVDLEAAAKALTIPHGQTSLFNRISLRFRGSTRKYKISAPEEELAQSGASTDSRASLTDGPDRAVIMGRRHGKSRSFMKSQDRAARSQFLPSARHWERPRSSPIFRRKSDGNLELISSSPRQSRALSGMPTDSPSGRHSPVTPRILAVIKGKQGPNAQITIFAGTCGQTYNVRLEKGMMLKIHKSDVRRKFKLICYFVPSSRRAMPYRRKRFSMEPRGKFFTLCFEKPQREPAKDYMIPEGNVFAGPIDLDNEKHVPSTGSMEAALAHSSTGSTEEAPRRSSFISGN